MKRINLIVLIFLVISYTSISGQENDKKEAEFNPRISNFRIQTGFFTNKSATANLSDFTDLVSDSEMLEEILTLPELEYYGFPYGSEKTSTMSVNLGIDFFDASNDEYANPHLRLGFSYHAGTNKKVNVLYEDKTRYDTLVSNSTDQIMYLDSVNSHRYSMEYMSEQVRFDASLVYRTSPERRCVFYAGAGITAGMSVNTSTKIRYDYSEFVESGFDNSSSYSYDYFRESYSDIEFHTNKLNYGFSIFIPVGIDFRLGKEKSFWKEMHLFFEMRPGINGFVIPELDTYTYAVVHSNIGLKYEW